VTRKRDMADDKYLDAIVATAAALSAITGIIVGAFEASSMMSRKDFADTLRSSITPESTPDYRDFIGKIAEGISPLPKSKAKLSVVPPNDA